MRACSLIRQRIQDHRSAQAVRFTACEFSRMSTYDLLIRIGKPAADIHGHVIHPIVFQSADHPSARVFSSQKKKRLMVSVYSLYKIFFLSVQADQCPVLPCCLKPGGKEDNR